MARRTTSVPTTYSPRHSFVIRLAIRGTRSRSGLSDYPTRVKGDEWRGKRRDEKRNETCLYMRIIGPVKTNICFLTVQFCFSILFFGSVLFSLWIGTMSW